MFFLTLLQLGRGRFFSLGAVFNNLVMSQDIKVKLFKFSLTLLKSRLAYGDSCHCAQLLPWQPFVMNVSESVKVKKLPHLAGHWLDLAQIWHKEVFLDS